MQVNIDFKYNIDDKVEFLDYCKLIEGCASYVGYIVGYKYMIHPFVENPIIQYGILKETEYDDYKKSILKGETPFNWGVTWRKEEDIFKKLDYEKQN